MNPFLEHLENDLEAAAEKKKSAERRIGYVRRRDP